MSWTDVMYGPLGQANNVNQANLAQNAAAMQQQQNFYNQQAALAAQNQAQLNNLYGPQGFGGQTAQYAAAGAAYGRGTGYYGDTSGLSPGDAPKPGDAAAPNVFNTGAVTSYDPNAPFGGGYVGASSTMGTSSGNFNTSGYYNANPDALAAFKSNTTYDDPTAFAEYHLKAAYNNPADHSIRTGWETTANPDFNAQGYYQANPDAWQAFAGSDSLDPTAFAEQHLKAAYNNPADGSMRTGWGADNPNFDAAGYYMSNPDAWQAFAGSDAFDPTAFAEQHLKAAYNNPADGSIRGGWSPANSDFDAAGYYAANPDAWQAYVNGGWGANANDPTAFAETHLLAAHNNEGGNTWRTGWQPSNSDFDTQGYFNANPDAAQWFGTGTTGYTDPTKFAEFHLGAAHAAEGGMRGGWATTNPDFDVQGYFNANPDALDAYGKGFLGIDDPTKFAEAHLQAAHDAEGGGYRGGWLTNSDSSFDTAGWFGTHPDQYQGYFNANNPYTNPTAYAIMASGGDEGDMSDFQSPTNDYSTFQKGPSYNWTASIPAGRSDPATINAIYRAAGTTGLSPAALAAMMNMESTWDPKSSMLGNYGLPQLSANMWGDYGGNFGGMDFNTFKGATGDRQIDAYADWLMKSNNLNKGGIDVASQTDPVMQAALLQAIQFGGNAMNWRTALAGGNMNVPVTTSPQAGDLGTTSINDMYSAYDKMMNPWQR